MPAPRAADRLAMPRRRFLRSLCAVSTVLLALDACTREAHRARPEVPTRAGRLLKPPEATTEPEAAGEAVGGEEFIMDVQGHLLEYDLNPVFNGEGFYASPQQYCGEDDPRVCYSIEHFLESFFIRSDTDIVVLSALRSPEGSPLSPEIMAETRRIVEGLCRDERVLLHGQVLPNVGSLDSVLRGMEDTASRYEIRAWKTFTHFPDFFDPGAAHGGSTTTSAVSRRGRAVHPHEPRARHPDDLRAQGAVRREPVLLAGGRRARGAEAPRRELRRVPLGFESGTFEGPHTAATAEVGVNRLIASLERAGVGPNENVYAELGTTWWNPMRAPTQAAHVLGKLLTHVGEDSRLGDRLPVLRLAQPQIQAFRAFHISSEFQERYGYPALTKELKAKVLGLNAARLYGIPPEPPRLLLAAGARTDPGGAHDGDRLLGPATLAASADVREHHRLEVSTSLAWRGCAAGPVGSRSGTKTKGGDPGLRSVGTCDRHRVSVLAVLRAPTPRPLRLVRRPRRTAAPATTSAPTCSATACSCGAGGPIPRRLEARVMFMSRGEGMAAGSWFPVSRHGTDALVLQARQARRRRSEAAVAVPLPASPTTGGATRPRSSSCSASSPSPGYRSAAVSWFPYALARGNWRCISRRSPAPPARRDRCRARRSVPRRTSHRRRRRRSVPAA